MKRIFIVDDHRFMRETLAAFIDAETDMAACGAAGSTAEALACLPLDADLVLVDLRLGKENGLDLVRRLRTERPHLKTVVLSAGRADVYRTASLEAGAQAYVEKTNVDMMLDVLRSVDAQA